LEDKVACKLPTWGGNFINIAGRTARVRSVLTSQAIYFLTPLIIPSGTLEHIKKIQRAFLWSAKEKTIGAQCKVNWDKVCRPKGLGGLGVLNIEKFARALSLRWPWLEWRDEQKIWVGSGNPCTPEDMSFFYAATSITIGNGERTSFWETPWLNGNKPKDIAPLIFLASRTKRWNIKKSMENNAWIGKIALNEDFSLEHAAQYVSLWIQLSHIRLTCDMEDSISWRLTTNGKYTTASAYKAQFFGATSTNMNRLIWKVWATPKVKFFAWLAIQNRLWTADRLEKRGWPNCGLCPLCKREPETITHLLINCRYTVRLWDSIRAWLDIHGLNTQDWSMLSIES
jgi:hypothetical protein